MIKIKIPIPERVRNTPDQNTVDTIFHTIVEINSTIPQTVIPIRESIFNSIFILHLNDMFLNQDPEDSGGDC